MSSMFFCSGENYSPHRTACCLHMNFLDSIKWWSETWMNQRSWASRQQPAKMITLRQPQPLLIEWRVQWDCCCFRWIIRRKISMSWRGAAYCELSRCSDRVSLLKRGRLTGVPSLLQCISDHNAGQVAQITYHPICRNNWISACCSSQSVHSADYHDLALATKRAAISFDAQRTVPPRWINK